MAAMIKEMLQMALTDAFWAAIPAVGFAMLFAVPPRFLKYCAIVGALAHSMRAVMVHYGDIPIEWATLAASSFVSLVFVYLSRRLLAPRPVFTGSLYHSHDPGEVCLQYHYRCAEHEQSGCYRASDLCCH